MDAALTQPAAASFIDLPAEVRLMVYNLLLVRPEFDIRRQDHLNKWTCCQASIQPQFLAVCRLVANEAVPFLYSFSQFRFRLFAQCIEFLNDLNPQSARMVQSVYFLLDFGAEKEDFRRITVKNVMLETVFGYRLKETVPLPRIIQAADWYDSPEPFDESSAWYKHSYVRKAIKCAKKIIGEISDPDTPIGIICRAKSLAVTFHEGTEPARYGLVRKYYVVSLRHRSPTSAGGLACGDPSQSL